MGEKVSIIVPVYNVERYLDRCVQSLVAQTYQNIEIILVDDGATDASGQMCDLWQERDGRIRAVHKPNGGLSDARNFGLHQSVGDYICFVDSDDWVSPRYVEVMMTSLMETAADIAECTFLATKGDGDCSPEINSEKRVVFDGPECFHRFLTEELSVVAWNKLYKRALIENEPFKVGAYHEDVSWTYKIFGKVNRVCKLYYVGYFYFLRPGSIMNSRLTEKHVLDRLTAKTEMIDFTEKHFNQYSQLVYRQHIGFCSHLYHEVMNSSVSDKAQLQKAVMSSANAAWNKCSKADLSGRDWYRLSLFIRFPRLYCRVFYRLYCGYIVPWKQKRNNGES